MSTIEAQLLELLKKRSFEFGEFVLASGDVSNYYIDVRTSAVFSETALLIGECIYERTKGLNIDAIGGLAVGAVPLTTAAVISYHLHGKKMEGFWVRDEVKTHGKKKLIEGTLKSGSRVVIVDDVFTQGKSALKAVKAVKELGCEVVLVLALVDRLQGARELFHKEGIDNFEPIFDIRDFGVEVNARKKTETVSV